MTEPTHPPGSTPASRTPQDLAPPEGWRALLQRLLPEAMRVLEERLGGPDLLALHGEDRASTEAALLSAYSSFRRHLRDGDLDAPDDLSALAGHFIRIAYNRWQRQRRRQRRLDAAVANGTTRSEGGEHRALVFEDPAPGPADLAAAADYICHIRQAVEEVRSSLSARDQRIVQLWLAGLHEGAVQNQDAIARALGVYQSTVSRCIKAFRDQVRRLVDEGGEGADE